MFAGFCAVLQASLPKVAASSAAKLARFEGGDVRDAVVLVAMPQRTERML